MDLYCEQHYVEVNCDEDNFLLDDKNAMLLNEFKDKTTTEYCIRCRFLQKELERAEKNKLPLNNGDQICHTIQFSNRRHSNSGDSTDSPLLDSGVNMSENYNDPDFCYCHSFVFMRNTSIEKRKLLLAAIFCLIFMISEIVGGYVAGSLAIMTDAAHLLSDFVGFLVSIISIWLVNYKPTKKMPQGYCRAGALLSISIIWSLSILFIYLSVMRIIQGEYDIDANTMIVVSCLGVAINIATGSILHGNCCGVVGGHHGHSHHHEDTNINIRAATIHVLGDLLQSLGVLTAAIIIKFYPNAKIADPICTLFFSFLVIFTTSSILKDTFNILMEGFPRNLNYTTVYTALTSLNGVRNVHNLYVWSLTTDKYVLTAHVAVDANVNKDDMIKRLTTLVRTSFKIQVTTFQIETYNEREIEKCISCKILPD